MQCKIICDISVIVHSVHQNVGGVGALIISYSSMKDKIAQSSLKVNTSPKKLLHEVRSSSSFSSHGLFEKERSIRNMTIYNI